MPYTLEGLLSTSKASAAEDAAPVSQVVPTIDEGEVGRTANPKSSRFMHDVLVLAKTLE